MNDNVLIEQHLAEDAHHVAGDQRDEAAAQALPTMNAAQIQLRNYYARKGYLTHAERRNAGKRKPFVRVQPDITKSEDFLAAHDKISKRLLDMDAEKIIDDVSKCNNRKTQEGRNFEFYFDEEPQQKYRLTREEPDRYATIMWVVWSLIMALSVYNEMWIMVVGLTLLTFFIRERTVLDGKLMLRRRFVGELLENPELDDDYRTELNSGLVVTMDHLPMKVTETTRFVLVSFNDEDSLDDDEKVIDVTGDIMMQNELDYDQLKTLKRGKQYIICGELYSQLTGPNFMNFSGDVDSIRESMERCASKYCTINFNRYEHSEMPFMNLSVRAAHYKLKSLRHDFMDASF